MASGDEFLNFMQSQPNRGLIPTPVGLAQPADDGMGFGSRVGQGLGTAARFVGGAFEPLLLPQDAFFSLLAGARDQNKSPLDYWREMEWAKYAPWGATPERAASGADLLRLYGVEDETTQKWGGIVLDLAADPLLIGGYITGIGRALKAVGYVDDVAKGTNGLIRLGQNIDDSLSLIPITRQGQTRSAFHTFLPKEFREDISEKTTQAITSLFNQPFFKQIKEGAYPFLSRRQALQSRFGVEGGRELQQQEAIAQSTAGEIREYVTGQFQYLNDLLGFETGNWFGNLFEAIGLRSKAARHTRGFKTGTQQAILKQAQRVTDNHGALMFGDFTRFATETGQEGGQLLQGELRPVAAFLGSMSELQPTGMQRLSATEDLEAGVRAIRKAAKASGDDMDMAERAFRETVRIVSESDALVGYHLSMYPEVQKAFARATAEFVGYKASDVWNEIIRAGIEGRNINNITDFVVRESGRFGVGRPGDITQGSISVKSVLGTETLGEFLSKDRFFARLDLNEFAQALGRGHMRRAYGVMLDPGGFERYMKRMDPNEGPVKLLPSTMVDEDMIEPTLARQGLGEAGRLIREFFEGVTPETQRGFTTQPTTFLRQGSPVVTREGRRGLITDRIQRTTRGGEPARMATIDFGRATEEVNLNQEQLFRLASTTADTPGTVGRAARMGTVVPTETLVRHLLDNGISPADAQRAVDALIGEVSGSPAYAKFVEKARKAISEYRSVGPRGQRAISESVGPGARQASRQLAARQNLEEEYLEILGELANPLISLDEATRVAERSLPTDVYLKRLYEYAERNNLVSSEYTPGMYNPLSIREADQAAVGAFAGKYVHPAIEKEIKRAVRMRDFRTPQWLERISQFIRGSLLAGPNILTANLGGGIYTSSLLGVNPMRMTRHMLTTLADAARASYDPDFVFDDYLELRQIIPLDLSRMSDAALVERGSRKLLRDFTGESPQGARQTVEAIGDLLRTFIDNPVEMVTGANRAKPARQVGAAFGLQGFAASEGIMKMAAFRAAKEQGFTPQEAAEIARLSTFDYSELPDILRVLRDMGLLMFPGFSYFMPARTVSGILRKPGAAAAWNRVPEAVMNAQDVPEEDRYALWASMPEWMKEDLGIPVRRRTGPQGEDIYSVVPINQFLPINTLTGKNLVEPFAGSALSLGIYQPFFELVYAAFNGGEALLSARYGQQVFEPGRGMAERATQALGFMYNNLAPSGMRKMVGYTPGAGFQGVLPSIADSFVDLPGPLAQLGYDMNTLQAERVMRDLVDNVISASFRSVQPVALGGRFPTVARTFNQAVFEHNAQLETLQQDFVRAQTRGNQEEMQRIREKVIELNNEFREKWIPMIRAARAGQ